MGQLAFAGFLLGFLVHSSGCERGQHRDIFARPRALRERRLDDAVLLRGGHGNKARAGGGRAQRPQKSRSAGNGCHRRHGCAGSCLCAIQRRRRRTAGRLGNPDGHRHSFRPRRGVAARQPSASLADDFLADACHRRRHRLHPRHRRLLHERPLVLVAVLCHRPARGGADHADCESLVVPRLSAGGRLGVVGDVQIGGSRHDSRGVSRLAHPRQAAAVCEGSQRDSPLDRAERRGFRGRPSMGQLQHR